MSALPPPPTALVSIVDDDASVRRALQRLVQSAGFSVETFASGHEALGGRVLGRTACLVIDVYLGDMTGFELQRLLKAGGVSVPMIFITAHDDVPTSECACRAGAVAYLLKPIDGDILLDAIRRAVNAA